MLSPDAVELADIAASWRCAYVHIPFCRSRCPYCDFAVVAPEDQGADDIADLTGSYMAALDAEIAMEPEWGSLDAVNFGGGTPSAVGTVAIESILRRLKGRFGIAPGAEISVEANPEDVTYELLEGFLAAGVNRVSLGVQSFDQDVLTFLGRSHTAAQAEDALRLCLPSFSTNVDLIFGAPVESLESWHVTVDRALQLYPHHLSAYALTVETGTRLWQDVRAGAAAPDADDQADKYETVQAASGEANLVQYEVSNYAQPGNTSRYNLATWGQGEYIGFGLGAHGHRNNVRRRNVRSIGAYLAAVDGGERPEAGRQVVEDSEMERLILGLRRSCGVDLGEWEDEAANHPGIGRLVAAGVVQITRGRLRVLQPLLADEVGATVLSLSP